MLPKLSVVLPVFNEDQTIFPLYERLTTVMRDAGHTYELIFVNDGSVDNSLPLLKKLPLRIRILRS